MLKNEPLDVKKFDDAAENEPSQINKFGKLSLGFTTHALIKEDPAKQASGRRWASRNS
jgi:hypothetical protein